MADGDEPTKCRHGNDAATCQHCRSDGITDSLRKLLGDGDDGDDEPK